MNKREMISIVQQQLAIDLNCATDDLNGEKDSFVFTEAKDNIDRRPYPRGKRHFEMLSMGKAIVISASPDILQIVKPALSGKWCATRQEDNEINYIYAASHRMTGSSFLRRH